VPLRARPAEGILLPPVEDLRLELVAAHHVDELAHLASLPFCV
jgi:hypothetical protein